MSKHAAAKKSVFEAPMTYLMTAMLVTGLMIGAMIPSYAGPATTEHSKAYVTKPILPALPLGPGFERFDK